MKATTFENYTRKFYAVYESDRPIGSKDMYVDYVSAEPNEHIIKKLRSKAFGMNKKQAEFVCGLLATFERDPEKAADFAAMFICDNSI